MSKAELVHSLEHEGLNSDERDAKRLKLDAEAIEQSLTSKPSPSSSSMDMCIDELKETDTRASRHKQKQTTRIKRTGYDWYHNVLNSPKYICAPMVDQSELPFRLLCLDYGTDLCYTPMINSKMFLAGAEKFREREFSTCEEEKGKVIAQFCGDNPDTVLAAAKLIERQVDGVDLNCGCPQGIAKKGHYGSYLLEEPDLICSIVGNLAKNLEYVPATCKIRKVNNSNTYQETINLWEQLYSVGCSALTIHGRVKEEKGHHTKNADWEIVKLLKQRFEKRMPIFSNGGIETFQDVERCLEYTGADAVMSAEALLEDPQLFGPAVKGWKRKTQDDIMEEYLNYATRFGTRPKTVKSHGFHMLYAGLQVCTDLRTDMGKAQSVEQIKEVCKQLKQRRLDDHDLSIPQLGWYMRYRKGDKADKAEKERGEGGKQENDNNKDKNQNKYKQQVQEEDKENHKQVTADQAAGGGNKE